MSRGGTIRHLFSKDVLEQITLCANIPISNLKSSRPKLFSTDIFQGSLSALEDIYLSGDPPLILAHYGGSDSIISLYATIAEATKNTGKPQILFMDRKPANAQVFLYKTILSHLADGDRDKYARLLIGLPDTESKNEQSIIKKNSDNSETEKYSRAIVKKKVSTTGIINLLDESLSNFQEYNPSEHIALIEKYSSEKIRNIDLRLIFDAIAKNIINYTSKTGFQKNFIKGLRNSLSNNNSTHYLSSDKLFSAVAGLITINDDTGIKTQFANITADISTRKGLSNLETLIQKEKKSSNIKNERLLDIAYIPHLMSFPKESITFFRDNAKYILTCSRQSDSKRKWILRSHHDMPIFSTDYRLKHKSYLLKKKNDDTIGLQKTLFISNLNFGYKYRDKDALKTLTEMAAKEGINNYVIGGLIYGPHIFTENARRDLQEHDARFLSQQLKQAKEYLDSIKGRKIVILGDGEFKLAEEWFNLYFWEKRRRAGDTRIARTAHNGLLLDRDAYNKVNDAARNIIRDHLIPYAIRIGRDPTSRFDEEFEGESCLIIELIDAIDRYYRLGESGLKSEDLNILDSRYLHNTEDLIIKYEHSESHIAGKAKNKSYNKKDEKETKKTSIRILSSINYSKITQYKDSVAALEEIVMMANNGTLPQLPEHIIVNTRDAYHFLKNTGNKVIMSIPDMVDDTQYFDIQKTNHAAKKILSDPVHKRVTVRKNLNLPGATIFQGDLREKAYFEIITPAIIERMKTVQKSGIGLKPQQVALIQDVQSGSITEDLFAHVRFMDYAFHTLKCIGAYLIGDIIQGRNYYDMPNENWALGGITVESQQLGMVRMQLPYIMLQQVEFWKAVQGNHEWNTDTKNAGINFLTPLQSAIEALNISNPNHIVNHQFPVYTTISEYGKSQLMKAQYGYDLRNDYGVLFGHKFSEGYGGKGSSRRPITLLEGWVRNVSGLVNPHHLIIGGHYHNLQVSVIDNTIVMLAPSPVGESGFEFTRQFGGNLPLSIVIDYKADGKLGFHVMSNKYLESEPIQNPFVKAKGIENFVHESFTQKAYQLGIEEQKPKQMVRRRLIYESGREIT